MLGCLKPAAYIVNVGRGNLIDEAALCKRLVSERLAGAALDVASIEPLPADSPLWNVPNLLLTPHVAGSGDPNALRRLAVLCATNALNWLEGRPLVGAL